MPLLTVGLPVRNGMPYLRQTMESLLSQSSTEFKILAIVGDCQDGSAEYLESVKDERLRVIVEERAGIVPALNRMLREVDTPWLMRQDADDVSYPRRVERTLEYIAKFPDAGMFCSIAEYYPPERSLGIFRASRGTPAELKAIVHRGYLLSFCHTAVTLNVQKILEVGGYTENLSIAEDADLWWRVALAYDIEIIPEVLVGYRQHQGQSTTQPVRQNVVGLLYVQYRLLSKLRNRVPLPIEDVRPYLERFVTERQIKARFKLRQVNIRISNHDLLGAITSGIAALSASPKLVLDRILDEVLRNRQIMNGINPEIYERNMSRFWNLPDTPRP